MSITVTRDRRGKMKHVVRVREHTFALDESAADGRAVMPEVIAP